MINKDSQLLAEAYEKIRYGKSLAKHPDKFTNKDQAEDTLATTIDNADPSHCKHADQGCDCDDCPDCKANQYNEEPNDFSDVSGVVGH
jgi:hypothetical protein